jgi:hypothetical protein
LDDGSTDRSREIAARFPKARIVDNTAGHCHEPERRQRLLEVAREYAAPRLLLALDCDEALTANYTSSPEWQTLLSAPPGTVFWFTLLNLCPDMAKCWQVSYPFPFGFIDDGSAFSTSILHGTRIPTPYQQSHIHLRDIRVLHYQFTDWARMQSKHRWYECYERTTFPGKSVVDIYRMYHHMYAIRPEELQPIHQEWVADYEAAGIDMTSVCRDSAYPWDREVLEMFKTHGLETFRYLDVWNANWAALATKFNQPWSRTNGAPGLRCGPRLLRAWLRRTQPRAHSRWVRIVDRVLRRFV